MMNSRLTHPQRRIIETELMISGTNINNIPYCIIFPIGQTDLLVAALRSVIDKIKELHLRFVMSESGDPEAYLYQNAETDDIIIEDLSALSEAEIKSHISTFLLQPFANVFDTRLYQFKIIEAQENTILCIRIHHAICDGSGIVNLINYIISTFESIAKSNEYELPENDYFRYVEIEDEYLHSQDCSDDRNYWLKHLQDLSDCAEGLHGSDSFESGNVKIVLSETTKEKLNDFMNSYIKPVSPFPLTLSLMNVFLARYFRSQSVVLTAGYSNRMYDGAINNSIGMLVSTVPLKTKYDDKCSFVDYLTLAKAELKAGLSHSRYPYNLLLADLRAQGIDTSKLMNFAIVSNAIAENPNYLVINPGISGAIAPIVIRVNMAKTDKKGLQVIDLSYRTSCFTEDEIHTIAACITSMIEDIAENPHKSCGEIRLLSKREEEETLNRFNKTRTEYEETTEEIIRLFQEQADLTPENTAAVYKGKTYSYRELDEITDRLARHQDCN